MEVAVLRVTRCLTTTAISEINNVADGRYLGVL